MDLFPFYVALSLAFVIVVLQYPPSGGPPATT